MNKYFKLLIIVIVVSLIALWGFKTFGSDNKRAIQLQTTTVKENNISTSVTATGTVEPVDQVEVGTQVSGLVEKIYVDYNSTVKKGQLLAELDKTTLNQSVANAQAAYNAALNELNYYQQNFNRQKNMYSAGVISMADYEQANYQIKNAAAIVAQRKTALVQAQANLGYAYIYSPINGIIISKEVEEGQTVAASMTTPTLFTIAKDINKMQVEADVDEADIGGVKEGQRVSFTVDAYPDETFSGKVRQVRLGATTTSNVVTYTVIIDADNPDQKLKPGLTATASIFTQELNNILTIEAQALNFSPDSSLLAKYYEQNKVQGKIPAITLSKEKRYVWIKNIDGSITSKEITVGTNDGVFVEVLSGVSEGEEVITNLEENVQSAAGGNAAESSPFMPKPPSRNNKKASAQ